ncbi:MULTISPECIES: glycosyltransferase family 2 protein [unclassified Empedobacter]|uniref:glycosyltransferase family 2 protein n=1 Tax=unclassified Empedobacter TaxID=2643773 RepID=UPI0025C68EC9|nr:MULTISPECIES: glycosyltransferase family 2 protein [unclassified Empedobacter]
MNLDVSIIIVTYNTLELTKACIESIITYTKEINYEIILVDNASVDGSMECFSTRDDIKYIYSDKNLGFGGANNIGVKNSNGKYLFLLNSDTLLIENSILKLKNFHEKHELEYNIGVLGATLCNQQLIQGNTAGMFPSVRNYVLDYINLYFRTNFQTYKKIDFSYLTRVDMVSGADMFLKKELFVQVNGFDEDYFLYFEETDLQKRISSLNKLNIVTNSTKIIHLEGASSVANNWKRKIYQNSQTLYFRKNDTVNFYWYVIFEILSSPIRFFNKRYTLNENLDFLKNNIIKLYENSVIRK